MHGDLGQYMKEYGPKGKTEAEEITRQILKGLVILHEREICHRDLKPQVRSLFEITKYHTNFFRISSLPLSSQYESELPISEFQHSI